MGRFRHHPDGMIVINELMMPLDFWMTLETAYALPEGYIGRHYEQEVQHYLSTTSTAFPQPLEWPEGDGYIDNEATYAAAWQAYRDSLIVPPTQEEIDAEARRSTTKTQMQQLTAGLGALSIEDRSYVILARIMAYKDGANNATIQAIVSKATATTYVTTKAKWTAIPNATNVKPMLGDMLEMMAGVVQVLMLVIE